MNQAHYIVEWIEFNRIQGVDLIVIYDDDSGDDVAGLVDALYTSHNETWVIVRPRPSIHGDIRTTVKHCLHTYGPRTEWLGLYDVDEYIFGFPPRPSGIPVCGTCGRPS